MDVILEKGDTIEVVAHCGTCEGCIFLVENGCTNRRATCQVGAEDVKYVFLTGPKQGDTVWVRNNNAKWNQRIFISKYNGNFVCANEAHNGQACVWSEMTTEDPYAIKYTLTPVEAIIAMDKEFKKVIGDKYTEGYYSVIREGKLMIGSKESIEKDDRSFDFYQMYTIVEE